MARRMLRGFVSHAHDDAPLVDRFLDVLRPRCAIRRGVELRVWIDRDIAAGERWRQEITTGLSGADFGLLCVSPSWLASSFIRTVELPELLREERVPIPLALEPLDVDGLDLNGLESLQVFHLRRPGEARGRSFDECRGVSAKRFCDELVGEIVRRLRGAGRVA